MDNTLVRGSLWVVAAVVVVLAVGWAGTGGCAGATNAQLRSDIDELASRVHTLEGKVRKLEGGSKAARIGKGKGKGKLPGAAKAKGRAGAEGKAKGADPALARGKAKAGKAQPAEDEAAEQIPPG